MVSTTHLSPLRDAATVLLLRESHQGLEVFLQERTATMAFAAGAVVFPGGSVDPTDQLGTGDWALPSPADLDTDEGPASPGQITAAAIRETYEECGVLLAGAPAEALGSLDSLPSAHHRTALAEHRTGVAQVLTEHGLTPALTSLSCVDRWVTPEGLPKRYDTRFIAAVAPRDQTTDDLTTETVRSFWASPQQVLGDFAAGRITLMQPTWAQLTRLAAAGDLAEALRPAGTGITRAQLRDVGGRTIAWGPGTEDYLAAGPNIL